MKNNITLVSSKELTDSEKLAKEITTLKNVIMPKGLADEDLQLFIKYCQKTGLDPFSRQIYALNIGKLSIQTSIDGLRVIAEKTDKYAGQESWWCGEDGVWKDVWISDKLPTAAKVSVYRKGFEKPISAVALMKEYNRKVGVWNNMPTIMISKCAEALALRKTFPNELSGLYTSEEMPSVEMSNIQENTSHTSKVKIDYTKHPVTNEAFINMPHQKIEEIYDWFKSDSAKKKYSQEQRNEYLSILEEIKEIKKHNENNKNFEESMDTNEQIKKKSDELKFEYKEILDKEEEDSMNFGIDGDVDF